MKYLFQCFKRGLPAALGILGGSAGVFTLLTYFPVPTLIALAVSAFLLIVVAIGDAKLSD